MAIFPNPFNSIKGLSGGRTLNLLCVGIITGTALLWRGSVKSGSGENLSIFLGIIIIATIILGVSIWLQAHKNS